MYRIYCSFSPNPNHQKHWRVERDHTRDGVTVPEGFKWNTVSVPAIFLPIIPKWGRYSSAALVHDYIYAMRGNINNNNKFKFTRKDADDIFYSIMIEDGVNKVKAKSMYFFVRLTGWKVWNRPKPN